MMKGYANLYSSVISLENIYMAEAMARKRKTLKSYVINFEKNLKQELNLLHAELALHSYRPQGLTTFLIRDPKTRKISKSEFRDRIVHHAIYNILGPIYEKKFIYDSCANREGKGTSFALRRLEQFKRKVTRNNSKVKGNVKGYALKADLKLFSRLGLIPDPYPQINPSF